MDSVEVDPKPKKLRLDNLRGKTVEASGRLVWRGGPERKQRPVLVLDSIAEAAPERKQAVAVVQQPQLKVIDTLFEDYSGGLSSQWQMKPGEDIVFSFRIDGFGRLEQLSKEGLREQHVNMHYFIGLIDPAGNAVVPGREGDIDTTLTMQDKDWRPKINWTAQVPGSAPPGTYKIQINVSDRIAHRQIEKDVPFAVVTTSALPPAPGGIEIVQLEYSNSENGPWSPERYFAPTDTIWVRYKVIGFRVSPENQVGVEQDWTVLNEEGKVLLSQTNAAGDNEKSFYAPRFLPTIFALNLKDPKPGKYTLRIDLRDTIANQNASVESDFFIRP